MICGGGIIGAATGFNSWILLTDSQFSILLEFVRKSQHYTYRKNRYKLLKIVLSYSDRNCSISFWKSRRIFWAKLLVTAHQQKSCITLATVFMQNWLKHSVGQQIDWKNRILGAIVYWPWITKFHSQLHKKISHHGFVSIWLGVESYRKIPTFSCGPKSSKVANPQVGWLKQNVAHKLMASPDETAQVFQKTHCWVDEIVLGPRVLRWHQVN